MTASPHLIPALALTLLTAVAAHPAAQIKAGPRGGKLVGNPPAQAELLISPEGIASLTFLDENEKPADPGKRTAALWAQLASGRQEIPLDLQDGVLVSRKPLPQPQGYFLVVQTWTDPEAKPVNTRLKFDLHHCKGCDLKEYACICTDH